MIGPTYSLESTYCTDTLESNKKAFPIQSLGPFSQSYHQIYKKGLGNDKPITSKSLTKMMAGMMKRTYDYNSFFQRIMKRDGNFNTFPP